jgi:hypothetical protein
MNTSENAPRSRGRMSSALASIERSGCDASNVVTRSVSDVDRIGAAPLSGSSPRSESSSSTMAASSEVLVRLPLWPSAMEPVAVARNVGWAFSQTLAPVVEYRQWPIDRCPSSADRCDSSNTCATRPMSL